MVGFILALVEQAEGHVVDDVEVREQGVILEHQTNAPVFRGDVRILVGNDLIVDDDPPPLQPFQPGGKAQERGLAGPRRPQQANHFAGWNHQRRVVENLIISVSVVNADGMEPFHDVWPFSVSPGRVRIMAKLSTITGKMPKPTMASAAREASPNCSSEANWCT